MTRRPKQPPPAETPAPDADAVLQVKVWLLDVSPMVWTPWMNDFERELMLFPNAGHDDQVDSMTQFLGWDQNKAEPAATQHQAPVVISFNEDSMTTTVIISSPKPNHQNVKATVQQPARIEPTDPETGMAQGYGPLIISETILKEGESTVAYVHNGSELMITEAPLGDDQAV